MKEIKVKINKRNTWWTNELISFKQRYRRLERAYKRKKNLKILLNNLKKPDVNIKKPYMRPENKLGKTSAAQLVTYKV